MLEQKEEEFVFEGTRDEIVSQLQALPDKRYHVEIVGVNEPEPPYNSLDEAIRKMLSRTPEEILATRAEILAKSPVPTPLPAGKTLEDMVAGTWPGNETDEEIRQALERLS